MIAIAEFWELMCRSKTDIFNLSNHRMFWKTKEEISYAPAMYYLDVPQGKNLILVQKLWNNVMEYFTVFSASKNILKK